MRTRATWIRWSLIGFAVIVVAVALGVHQRRQASSTTDLSKVHVPIELLAPTERDRTIAFQKLERLESLAPPFDRASFGGGARTAYFRRTTNISDAYSPPDGILFVVVSQTIPAGSMSDFYSLATLNGGVLQPVPMPAVGKYVRGYGSIAFISAAGNTPIVVAGDYDGHNYYYAVSPGGVARLGGSYPVTISASTLRDGETCAGDDRPVSPAAVLARTPVGRVQMLVSKAELARASGGLIDVNVLHYNTVRCWHLGPIDLLNIGDLERGVIFAVSPRGLTLVTGGAIMNSAQRHILIKHEEVGTGFIDYLEVYR